MYCMTNMSNTKADVKMSNIIKVNIATAMVLMIVTILLVTNHNTSKNASALSSTFSNKVLPSVDALHNMRFGVSRIVSSSNELLVISASRSPRTKALNDDSIQELASITEGRILFEHGLLEFRKRHMTDVGLSNQGPLLNDLELEFLALINTSDRIIEISRPPFIPLIVANLKNEFEQREIEILRIIEKIQAHERTHSTGLLQESMTSIHDMEFQTITLGGIFFVVIVVYSIFVLMALSNESESRQTTEQAILDKGVEVQRCIKLEKSLAHSRKLDSLGTLAGGIAHELNNQLLPVLTMSEMILTQMDADHADHRKLELILQGTENARNTIAKISNFSRTGEGRPDSCRAFEVCKNTKDVLLAGCPANVNLTIDIEESAAKVHMAADDLQGILVNLFSNGVDAMNGAEGEIHIQGLHVHIHDYANIHGLIPGDYVKIKLQDTGSGIPSAMVDRIFDPFFTTKDAGKGVGLGMAIVHATIESASGYIWLETEPGTGTTFFIHLPVVAEELEA